MYRIVLDTEALPNDKVYDFAFVVLNDELHEIMRYRMLVRETLANDAELQTAHYVDKLPQYLAAVARGDVFIKPFREVWGDFLNACAQYNVKEVWAHNATYDRRALNTTVKWVTNNAFDEFLPTGIKWRCSCAAAAQTICNSRNYFKFAAANGFVSPSGNVRTTAEAVYCYLIKDGDFTEEHTALADALIECEIVRAAKRYHKRMDATPSSSAWRYPQTKFKEWAAK